MLLDFKMLTIALVFFATFHEKMTSDGQIRFSVPLLRNSDLIDGEQ